MNKIINYAALICAQGLLLGALAGCAHKMDKYEDFNHTDVQWLEKISEHIKKDELEKADQDYISLYSEHILSPLLRTAALVLSKAHSEAGEYKLANYYIDEFNKLFGTAQNQDWCAFMKVRNDYYALVLPQRNQEQLLKALASANEFLALYKNSAYVPLVESIKTRLELAKYLLEKDIHRLYTRMGHTKSAEIINQRLEKSDFAKIPYIEPEKVWYRKIFE